MTSGHRRVACAVEGCARGTTTIRELEDGGWWLETRSREAGWVCGTHWRRVPRSLKRRRSALMRAWRTRLRRYGAETPYALPPGSPKRIALVRLERLIAATWSRCVRVASGEPTGDSEDLPPAVAEELRRMGL